ncbi:MAG: NAD+ synthase [Candidatus Omnitrophica bacterium CG11_big_fil_rev_8_21_14_0_20_42_13]|uniref:Glutamine-dependent NAD(+) synthetase n=1 Tax=Candidatus Ghiorseimicrobium undicola TaxID=1974746 RepID=A0A2H0LV08_9BACT|nr:MAG: NAD+ synthase [Candidatus Omnitrophica bacterium CG11_big_fil_rev_8_21_14_0_20_42_13]
MVTSKENLRIAIAQINPIVGDIEFNFNKIHRFILEAREAKADIVTFPELSLCGYPPEDLLLKNEFIGRNISALNKLKKSINDIIAVVGFVDSKDRKLYNAAAVIFKKRIAGIYRKILLPNYSVFDEKRYFSAGKDYPIFKISNIIFGVDICEDIWDKKGPLCFQANQGARIVFNISASPYYMSKAKIREDLLCQQAKKNKVFIVYTNIVGGQDELVFDGQSLIIDDKGRIMFRLPAFKEGMMIFDLPVPVVKTGGKAILIKKDINIPKPQLKPQISAGNIMPIEEVYLALVLGLKDYVNKNGFKKVVIGLSGGVDSSLVAALAVFALGADNVTGVFMPSQFSSLESREDAYELAKNLSIEIREMPIRSVFDAYLSEFSGIFKDMPQDITEENLQARIRGNMLMALSNKFGWLVLTTGNKSEVSCGYCTLYGDMAGGFSVIKDVPKTLVYKLAEFINTSIKEGAIPARVLIKEPTAELRHNQKDSDSLPEYELLDKILKKYVEEDKSMDEIIKSGFKKEVVTKVISLVDKSEYKRRQSAPGIKITPRAFGKDRRMPITNGFRNSV